MKQIGVKEARTRLSELIKCAELGESIIITRSGHPIAKLISVKDYEREAPSRDSRGHLKDSQPRNKKRGSSIVT